VYLDHNATSPLRPEARDAMLAAVELAGNPSSIHAEGRAARSIVEEARETIATCVGCRPTQVIFTSGGTEANVMALSPAWLGNAERVKLFTSAIEHPSVLQGGQFMAGQLEALPVGADGVIGLDDARRAFDAWRHASGNAPFLVSVMLANNETGVIQPIADLVGLAHEFGGILHCDAVQAFGKISVDVGALGADLITLSAHKIGGPKGVGALVILRDDLPVAALLRGGGQEFGYRAGTENVAAIAGFGAVAEAYLPQWEKIRDLLERLELELGTISPGLQVFGKNSARLPNTSCFAVSGMDAETVLIGLDLAGISVSSGSACSSGKVARSHVLSAMAVAPELSAAAIRVSLGWDTGDEDVERFIAGWKEIYGKFAGRRHAA
jgi:cysteine desulfurase